MHIYCEMKKYPNKFLTRHMIILVKTGRKNWLSFLDLGSQHLHLYRIMFINMFVKQKEITKHIDSTMSHKWRVVSKYTNCFKKGLHLERHIVLWTNSCHQTHYNWERCQTTIITLEIHMSFNFMHMEPTQLLIKNYDCIYSCGVPFLGGT
jgi:hypothetical protein